MKEMKDRNLQRKVAYKLFFYVLWVANVVTFRRARAQPERDMRCVISSNMDVAVSRHGDGGQVADVSFIKSRLEPLEPLEPIEGAVFKL